MLQVWYYQAAYGADMSKTKPKDIGTDAETDVVQWAKKHGWHGATRLVLEGSTTGADIKLNDRIMIQVKAGYTEKIKNDYRELRERKEPTDFQIAKWLEATEKQRKNGGYEIGLLVHKRFGKADPDMWRWYIDGVTFIRLLLGDPACQASMPQYIQLQGYMIPPLLRNAGVTP